MEHTHCNQSLKMALWKDNCSLPTHLHMAITVSWLEVRADESVRGHHQQKLLELPFLAEPLPHDEALTPPPLPAAVPASPVEVGDAGSATTPIPWASLGESLWEPPSVKPTPHTRFSTAHPRLEVSAEEDTPYTVAQTEDKGASASHARDRHKSIKPRRLDEPAAEVTRIMLSTGATMKNIFWERLLSFRSSPVSLATWQRVTAEHPSEKHAQKVQNSPLSALLSPHSACKCVSGGGDGADSQTT
jgi:hypothetical protein